MIRNLIFTAATFATLVMTSGPMTQSAQGQNIRNFVLSNGGAFDNNFDDYDILRRAIVTANLLPALNDSAANLTLFAPDDLGFILLARDFGYKGFNEREAWNFLVGVLTDVGGGDPIPPLTTILLYHVVGQDMDVFQVIFANEISTLEGSALTVRNFNRLGDLSPTQTDPRLFTPLNLMFDNGKVHGINRVLLPFNPF